MSHTLIGLEVRHFRVDYAIHEIGPIGKHEWKQEGSLYIPSSQFRKDDYTYILDECLEATFRPIIDTHDPANLSVYCDAFSFPNSEAGEFYRWSHECLNAFFADTSEIVAMPLPRRSADKEPNTRKMLKTLESLQDFGYGRIRVNYIAYAGGQEIAKQLYKV